MPKINIISGGGISRGMFNKMFCPLILQAAAKTVGRMSNTKPDVLKQPVN